MKVMALDRVPEKQLSILDQEPEKVECTTQVRTMVINTITMAIMTSTVKIQTTPIELAHQEGTPQPLALLTPKNQSEPARPEWPTKSI